MFAWNVYGRLGLKFFLVRKQLLISSVVISVSGEMFKGLATEGTGSIFSL